VDMGCLLRYQRYLASPGASAASAASGASASLWLRPRMTSRTKSVRAPNPKWRWGRIFPAIISGHCADFIIRVPGFGKG
jgi:hypothetical protein